MLSILTVVDVQEPHKFSPKRVGAPSECSPKTNTLPLLASVTK